jgi:hypothetical protein
MNVETVHAALKENRSKTSSTNNLASSSLSIVLYLIRTAERERERFSQGDANDDESMMG